MSLTVSLTSLLTVLIACTVATPGDEFGMNCTLRSSCQLSPDKISYHMNCGCDDTCATYGDCCHDVDPRQKPLHDKLGDDVMDRMSCVDDARLDRRFPVYIMQKCETHFPDEAIKQKCENVTTGEPEFVGNMFPFVPVTGLASGILYRNSFCALCNNEKEFEFWRVNISADDVTLMDAIKSEIAKSDWEAISSIKHMVEFSHQKYQAHMCKESISKCASKWPNDEHRRRCSSGTTDYVYHIYDIYRNKDCAICNNISEGDTALTCVDGRAFLHSPNVVFKHPPSFSILFDLNRKRLTMEEKTSGGWVTREEVVDIHCKQGNVYDPFTGECRELFCLPGYILKNSKCISAEDGGAACGLISFQKGEFEYLQNHSIYIPVLDAVYEEGRYWTDGADILICNPNWDQSGLNITRNVTQWDEFFDTDPVQGYLTIALTVISLLGLAVQLIVYTVFKELQNTPGKCLMCLSASLLVSQLLFVIGANMNEIDGLCKAIAIIIHFGFLAYFFWMNVMAFDIFRSFTSAKSQSFYSSRKRTVSKRFIHYSLYAWMSPLLIVLISIILEFAKVEQVMPDYGKAFCWFGNKNSQLIFFVVPVSLLILSDIIFFCLTVREIYKVNEGSRKIKMTKNNAEKKRLGLYIKLAFIMGFTWILGFVATLLRNTVVWYIFVVLNSLQGLWIFITFVCTAKVMNLIKGRYYKRRPLSTTASTRTRSTVVSDSRNSALPTKVWKKEGDDSNQAAKEPFLKDVQL